MDLQQGISGHEIFSRNMTYTSKKLRSSECGPVWPVFCELQQLAEINDQCVSISMCQVSNFSAKANNMYQQKKEQREKANRQAVRLQDMARGGNLGMRWQQSMGNGYVMFYVYNYLQWESIGDLRKSIQKPWNQIVVIVDVPLVHCELHVFTMQGTQEGQGGVAE